MTARNFVKWFASGIAKELASLPSDNDRHRYLILYRNQWSGKYISFIERDEQPFAEPHPDFGDVTEQDFVNGFAEIDRQTQQLVRARWSTV